MLKGLASGVSVALVLSACGGDRATFPDSKPVGDIGDAGDHDGEASSREDTDSVTTEAVPADTSDSGADHAREPIAPEVTSDEPDSNDDMNTVAASVVTDGDETEAGDELEAGSETETGSEAGAGSEAVQPTDETTGEEPTTGAQTTDTPAPPSPPECGNGVLEAGEDCDDSNLEAGDGCDECEIAKGWLCTDEPSDCDDIDECEEDMHDCDEHALCTNNDGSFECDCEGGYSGNGKTCSNVDECSNGETTCDAHASCEDADGAFDCVCNPGYTGSGESCTDVDECTMGTDNCGAHSTCTNDPPGRFTCECNEGYRGDGIDCVDVDECAAQTDNCDANAKCTNTPGGFACGCHEGYTGNGEACTDVNECAPPTSHDCSPNADCENIPAGSFTCTCKDGYSGDGHTCNDVNECSTNKDDCHAYAQCENIPVGSYTCTCLEPYMGDGKDCGCRSKSVDNVLGQGGFDDASSVTEQGSAVAWPGTYEYEVTWWEDDDADACPDSGSIRFVSETSEVGGIYGLSGICANVEPDTSYHFGYKYKRDAYAGFGCQLILYTGEDCSGDFESLVGGVHVDEVNSADTLWRSTPAYSFMTGSATGSVKVYCQSDYNVSNFDYIAVLVDQVYLNADAAEY